MDTTIQQVLEMMRGMAEQLTGLSVKIGNTVEPARKWWTPGELAARWPRSLTVREWARLESPIAD